MRHASTFALMLLIAGCSSGEGVEDPNTTVESLARLSVDAQLAEMGPDGWHRIALYGNWDFTEPEVWRWIVTRPSCDRATALAIFWKATPEYYLQYARAEDVPAGERETYALIGLIRHRWTQGLYQRSELAFNPDADAWPLNLAELKRRHGERVEQLIPASMRISLPGRHVPDEGPPLPGVLRP